MPDRDNQIGAVEIPLGLNRLSEELAEPSGFGFMVDRIPCVPVGIGKSFQKSTNLRGLRRGRDSRREQSKTSALFLLLELVRQAGKKCIPRTDAASVSDRLRTIRIIQVENSRLGEHVRCAQ